MTVIQVSSLSRAEMRMLGNNVIQRRRRRRRWFRRSVRGAISNA